MRLRTAWTSSLGLLQLIRPLSVSTTVPVLPVSGASPVRPRTDTTFSQSRHHIPPSNPSPVFVPRSLLRHRTQGYRFLNLEQDFQHLTKTFRDASYYSCRWCTVRNRIHEMDVGEYCVSVGMVV